MNELTTPKAPPKETLLTQRSDTKSNPALLYILSLASQQSRDKVIRSLNQIARDVGYSDLHSCQWALLRREHVLALVSSWQNARLAPATINNRLSMLKSVAAQAWMDEQMSDHDYTMIRLVKPARGSRLPHGRALSEEESHKIIEACTTDSSVKGVRDTAILAIGIGCGLRRSEIAALQLKDVKMQEKALRVIGKGNAERFAYCPQRTWELIQSWLDIRGLEEGSLFCAIRKSGKILLGESITDSAVYKAMITWAKHTGIKQFSPHDLRRTFATRLFEMGGDVNLVRRAMGHSSIETTTRYDKRPDDAVRELTTKIQI